MNNTISELSYSEFRELVLYLKKDDDNFYPVFLRLNRFFPTLNAEQSIMFGNIVDKIMETGEDEDGYEWFKNMYPDLELDTSGRSVPDKISYSDISLIAVEMAYNKAIECKECSGKKRFSKQIIAAKTLEPLEKIKDSRNYAGLKLLYLKKDNIVIRDGDFKYVENVLKKLVGNTNAMKKVLLYVYDKKPDNCKYFIEHFLIRLKCCSSDTDLKNTCNKEFLEKLKKISE